MRQQTFSTKKSCICFIFELFWTCLIPDRQAGRQREEGVKEEEEVDDEEEEEERLY